MLHDPPEQVWIETLNDIVNPGFATGEDEILVVIKAVAGRAAGGQRLVHPGLPWPEPDRINMRVEYPMDCDIDPIGRARNEKHVLLHAQPFIVASKTDGSIFETQTMLPPFSPTHLRRSRPSSPPLVPAPPPPP